MKNPNSIPPETFGLKEFPGKVFRIDEFKSGYSPRYEEWSFSLQILSSMDNEWVDFGTALESELWPDVVLLSPSDDLYKGKTILSFHKTNWYVEITFTDSSRVIIQINDVDEIEVI